MLHHQHLIWRSHRGAWALTLRRALSHEVPAATVQWQALAEVSQQAGAHTERTSSSHQTQRKDESLQGTWHKLLGKIRGVATSVKQSSPTKTKTPPDLLDSERERRETREMLVSFARMRADLLFALPPSHVSQFAQLGMLPRGYQDRRLAAATKRLQTTFPSPEGIQGTLSPGAEGDRGGGPPVQPASLQDLLRVMQDWVTFPESHLSQLVPGAPPLIQGLMLQLMDAVDKPVEPGHLARAELAATPTEAQLAARRAAEHAALMEELAASQPVGSRSAAQSPGQPGVRERQAPTEAPAEAGPRPKREPAVSGAKSGKPQRGAPAPSLLDTLGDEGAVRRLIARLSSPQLSSHPRVQRPDTAAGGGEPAGQMAGGGRGAGDKAGSFATAVGSDESGVGSRDSVEAIRAQEQRAQTQQDDEEDYAVRRLSGAAASARGERSGMTMQGSSTGRRSAREGQRGEPRRGRDRREVEGEGDEGAESDEELHLGATDVNQPDARRHFDDFYAPTLASGGQDRGSRWERQPGRKYDLEELLRDTEPDLGGAAYKDRRGSEQQFGGAAANRGRGDSEQQFDKAARGRGHGGPGQQSGVVARDRGWDSAGEQTWGRAADKGRGNPREPSGGHPGASSSGRAARDSADGRASRHTEAGRKVSDVAGVSSYSEVQRVSSKRRGLRGARGQRSEA